MEAQNAVKIIGKGGNRMASKYAVLVGYDCKPSAPIYGSNEARLIKGILTKAGFPSKNIKMLLNRQATLQNVANALDWLRTVEAPDSKVVVGFFSHGGWGSVLVYQGNITHATILSLLPVQSQRQLVMVDTCGSAGAILPGMDGVTLCAPGRIVFTSTALEIESTVYSGKYSDWLRIVWMMGYQDGAADLNGDGRVSMRELATWTQKGLVCNQCADEFFLDEPESS
jgi:hypothetical protein